jgi:hypothetical protein
LNESFDPAELAAAERLDAAIDGRPAELDAATAAVLTELDRGLRVPEPPGLTGSVARRVRERRSESARSARLRPVRVAAALLGVLMVLQGLPPVVAPDWFAEEILDIEPHAHAFREASAALFAVAALLLWAAARPRWLTPAVVIGSTLSIVLLANGTEEVAEGKIVGGGGAHLSVGIAGIVLAALWWRYARRPRRE